VARRLAHDLGVPIYDVQIVGYPERMRAYNARLKASGGQRVLRDPGHPPVRTSRPPSRAPRPPRAGAPPPAGQEPPAAPPEDPPVPPSTEETER
jgi:hypothetical protein